MAGDGISLVAIVTPKPGRADDVKKALTSIAQGVEKDEPDCLQYEVTIQEDTGQFVVVEKYASMAALEIHRKQPYYIGAFKEYGDAIDGAPDLKVLKVLTGFASRK